MSHAPDETLCQATLNENQCCAAREQSTIDHCHTAPTTIQFTCPECRSLVPSGMSRGGPVASFPSPNNLITQSLFLEFIFSFLQFQLAKPRHAGPLLKITCQPRNRSTRANPHFIIIGIFPLTFPTFNLRLSFDLQLATRFAIIPVNLHLVVPHISSGAFVVGRPAATTCAATNPSTFAVCPFSVSVPAKTSASVIPPSPGWRRQRQP